MIAITLTAWPPIARLARAETLSLRQADFISAVRLQGPLRPRAVAPYCAAVPAVGDYSYHHEHGGDHPDRRWSRLPRPRRTAAGAGVGAMISSGRTYMMECWWVVTIPGLAILINSLAFNFLGDGLRDILDPRSE